MIQDLRIQDLRTSLQWNMSDPIRIYDPDGWDRKNFQYSFYEEKITYGEYVNRRNMSTCQFKKEFDVEKCSAMLETEKKRLGIG